MDNIGENKKSGGDFTDNKKKNPKTRHYPRSNENPRDGAQNARNGEHTRSKNYYNKRKNFKNTKKAEASEVEEAINSPTEIKACDAPSPNSIRTLPQSGWRENRTANPSPDDAAKEKPAGKKPFNKPKTENFSQKNASPANPPETDADTETVNGKAKTKPPRRKHKKAPDIHSVLKTYGDLQENGGSSDHTENLPPNAGEPPADAPPPSEETAGTASVSDAEKVEIIGVRYKPVGKIYFFDPAGLKFNKDDAVIVETTKGVELGFVAIANRREPLTNIVQPLKPIVRVADEKDLAHYEENKIRAKETMRIAREKIQARDLKMKLIDAEYTFDNLKLLYYFTADGRVDFRELAKDLAAVFKVRIDLRQIGPRDQPKMMGGLSICGRPFCCSTFLPVFDQVTIKMAKDQNISINSAKISGACGKLMCCLKYEQEMYEREIATTPKTNSIVETPEGTGVVIDGNVISGILRVSMNAHAGEGRVIKNIHKSAVKVIGFLKSAETDTDAADIEK